MQPLMWLLHNNGLGNADQMAVIRQQGEEICGTSKENLQSEKEKGRIVHQVSVLDARTQPVLGGNDSKHWVKACKRRET